jgi:hypothetical protein
MMNMERVLGAGVGPVEEKAHLHVGPGLAKIQLMADWQPHLETSM